MAKHCDVHYSDPIEAEPVARDGLRYLQLRCPECNRLRGLRLIRTIPATAVVLAENGAAATVEALKPARTETRQVAGGTLTLHFFAEFSNPST